MRQRGAGYARQSHCCLDAADLTWSRARTVSSNFGFSFAVSAPTSHDATPIPEEPRAKRRKTVLQTGPTAIGTTDNETAAIYKSFKAPKSRRRLALDEDDNAVGRRVAFNGDDSFLSGLQAKRKAATRREKDATPTVPELVVAEETSKPTTKRGSKRRAAVTATAKVTDGLVEQAAPIDKRRRDAELEKKTERTRKKTTALARDTENRFEPEVDPTKTVEEDQKVQEHRPRAKPTKSNAAEKVKPILQQTTREQTSTSAIEEIGAKKATATSTSTSRKRKVQHTTTESRPRVELSVTEDSMQWQENEEIQMSRIDASADTTFPIKRPRKKTSKRTEPKKAAQQEISAPGLERQPLKETYVNPTRSLSPEKPVKEEKKASRSSHARYKVGERDIPIAIVVNTTVQKRGKRPNVQILRDLSLSETGEAATKIAPSGREALLHNEPSAASDAAERTGSTIDQDSLLNPRMSRPDGAETSIRVAYRDTERAGAKRKRLQEEAPASTLGTAMLTETKSGKGVTSVGRKALENDKLFDDERGDDDIDWIFASQEPRQRPQATTRTSRRVPKAPNKKAKMADIDLDDLLSNIASFAQTETESRLERPGGESQVQDERQRTKASRRKKK